MQRVLRDPARAAAADPGREPRRAALRPRRTASARRRARGDRRQGRGQPLLPGGAGARRCSRTTPIGAEQPVPDTVHDVLRGARRPAGGGAAAGAPDRLGAGARVPAPAARGRLGAAPAASSPTCAELRRLEFIHEQGGEGEPVYVFKHALTQDVAYESLLSRRRARLHEAAGRGLEALYADRLERGLRPAGPPLLADRPTEKAVEYLGLFADSAVKALRPRRGGRSAPRGAAPRRAACRPRARPARLRAHPAPGVLALLPGRVRREPRRCSGPSRPARPGSRTRTWPGASTCGWGTPTPTPATATARRRASPAPSHEASRSGDVAPSGRRTTCSPGRASGAAGSPTGPSTGAPPRPRSSAPTSGGGSATPTPGSGSNLVNTGDFEEALANVARTKEIGRLRDDPRLQSYAGWEIAWYEATRGNWERAIAEGTESLERSPDPLNSAYSMFGLGFSYREKGDYVPGGVAARSPSIQLLTEFGYGRLTAWLTGWLSDAQLWSGDPATAAETARRAARPQRAGRLPLGRRRGAAGARPRDPGDRGPRGRARPPRRGALGLRPHGVPLRSRGDAHGPGEARARRR